MQTQIQIERPFNQPTNLQQTNTQVHGAKASIQCGSCCLVVVVVVDDAVIVVVDAAAAAVIAVAVAAVVAVVVVVVAVVVVATVVAAAAAAAALVVVVVVVVVDVAVVSRNNAHELVYLIQFAAFHEPRAHFVCLFVCLLFLTIPTKYCSPTSQGFLCHCFAFLLLLLTS